MSSDLEKLLRDAQEALPEPAETATQRVRRRSLATIRRKSRRGRVIVLLAATLVTAVALGVTAGSLNAPGVTAAREPAVLGFVPEPGWFALQSPPPAIEGQQTASVAANVPFAPDDVVNGLVEPSGLPYSTLLGLPPHGIVIVLTMVPEYQPHVAPVSWDPIYPERALPLRLRDGVPHLQWGAQVRPDQPLAQYQLRAKLAEYYVDVLVYFGTSRPSAAQMREAQRQLAGLVVRKQRAPVSTAEPVTAIASVAVIDRTYACKTVQLGGLYQVESRAHAGVRVGSQWTRLPYAVVASGGVAKTPFVDSAPDNSIAWVTAGEPSPATTIDEEWLSFTPRAGGTIGVNHSLCSVSNKRVALSGAELRGGRVGSRTAEFDCSAPRTVIVRIRATVQGGTALRDRARLFRATNAPASVARLAARTPAGRLLVFAEVSNSGRARLFTAKGCTRE